jgi:ribosome biogenesis GTPase
MDRRQGIVVRFHSNVVTVEDSLTQERFLCNLRGRFKAQNLRPIIGDVVEYINFPDFTGRIENIYPRRNELARPNIANIDQVVLVSTIAYPAVSSYILDRFLVLAERNGLEVCMVFNKIDLLKPEEKSILNTYKYFYSQDYTFIPVSAKTGEGISDVIACLSGKTSTLAGMSGVGKSTILNAIDPTLKLKEGEISRQLELGKHTTTFSELLPIAEKGLVADTPGFANLSLLQVQPGELRFCFPEFLRVASHCYYDDCLHDEEPDCMVRECAENGEIMISRYDNYRTMLKELLEAQRNAPPNYRRRKDG